jgi:murein DD-endopeptidase MepM/ murein hydrolase activator NlpD
MVPPATQLRVREARRQRQEKERNRRRFAVVAAFSLVAVVTGLLAAFGGSGGAPNAGPAPASASRLLPGGPPKPEIIANIGSLHLQLPVDQTRVTALGYQGGSEGSLALSPVGTQANQGLLRRLARTVFGSATGGPRWFQLPGGEGPATSAIDVGAAPGTDVYSPVDGTVVAIDDVVLNGSTLGSQVDIQPTVAPSLVVAISHIKVDTGLTVGSAVTSGGSRLGDVLDFSHAEQQALAHYTNDAGNHVTVEVHPAATLQAP